MKVGIGYANESDGYLSGTTVGKMAIEDGVIEKPDMVIAFCSGDMNHHDFFNGIKSIVGYDVPVVGGSAIGVITNNHLSYENFPSVAAIIESDNLKINFASAEELDKDEKEAGQKLGEILSQNPAGKLLLLFYDSVKKAPSETDPPVMNASPPLIEGIEEKLGNNIPIIGGGVLGDFGFNNTWQFCGAEVKSQSVTGIMLNGEFTPYCRIMHGCIPKDGIYHRVTKAEGAVIYELDGRPVVKVIDELYGNSDWKNQLPVNRLTLAVNHKDKFEIPDESDFVNRLIAGALPDDEGIILFEPDIKEEDEVLFMLRNGAMMVDSARKNTAELFDEIKTNGDKPVFSLYIDCAGRTSFLSDTLYEEASEVQAICKQNNVPLLGFYSGVEIAPFQGKSRGLDWTGVLLILAEN